MIEYLVFVFVAGLALGFGMFLLWKPLTVFAMQKKFYTLINWNIEPISLAKEVRNTRVMGLILILFVLGACLYRILG